MMIRISEGCSDGQEWEDCICGKEEEEQAKLAKIKVVQIDEPCAI